MVSLRDIDRVSVLSAVNEFDRVGRDEFLIRHAYGRARGYFLFHDGRIYDAKAIC